MIRVLAALAALTLPIPVLPGGSTTATFGVWTVHMTVVDYNFKTGDFRTPNRVSMVRDGGDVTADRATGNIKRRDAVLTGHVVLHDATGAIGGAARGPSTITADLVRISQSATHYVAIGSVHYEQGATVADAQTGTLDELTHTMTLEGGVRMLQGTRVMTADSVVYDTLTGKGRARHGTLQMPASGLPGHP